MSVSYHWQAGPFFFRRPHDCPDCKTRMEIFWDEERYASAREDPWPHGGKHEGVPWEEQIHYIKRLRCPICGKVLSAPQMKMLEANPDATNMDRLHRHLFSMRKTLLLSALMLCFVTVLALLLAPDRFALAALVLVVFFLVPLSRRLYVEYRKKK